MPPHARALIAAAAFALVSGRKVAGVYDHAAGRHLRIAAEARGDHLQGYDGDRDVRFGGTLPELREAGAGIRLHIVRDGETVRVYHPASQGHVTAEVRERQVQLYDHGEGSWFSYDLQVA